MRHTLQYAPDRRLAYAEYGDPAGFPILVQHGLLASIADGALFQRLVDAGRRVICLARPGYGESSPYPLRDVGEWGALVAVLADALALDRFDVLGMSSGAPYSYAIAAHMPERARDVFIFSGTPALFDPAVVAHWPYPVDRTATLPQLEALANELFFAPLSPADRRRPDIRDSMHHHGFGVALDLKLRCNAWGFSLANVRAPVHMQHGTEDAQVPFITAQLTAALLPNCRLDARPGDHFSPALLDAFFTAAIIGRDE